jgi:hypothetical protein
MKIEQLFEAYQNDESNLWYIYDNTSGKVKQRMVHNLDEPKARSMGYRDSIEDALKVAGIIRSKFDPKKWIHKQGTKWVPVSPFGQSDNVSEDHEIAMATSELKSVYINAKKLFDIIKQRSEQDGLDAWQQSKITKAADYLNSVLTAIRGEPRR